MKNDKSIHTDIRKIYEVRYSALKWILVTSFGYLGFNNAKFGRIDAHIAVCAFDRQVLLLAARIAERLGFRVLHGIVDSLWIKKETKSSDNDGSKLVDEKKAKENDSVDYLQLKEAIEQQTGLKVSFEGISTNGLPLLLLNKMIFCQFQIVILVHLKMGTK